MTWSQQRQLVKSLSRRVQARRRDARRIRHDLKGWMTGYLGSTETLVWLFAMGSFWAAGGSTAAKTDGTRRSLLGVINTSLLAWQLVHREVTLAHRAADHPTANHQ